MQFRPNSWVATFLVIPERNAEHSGYQYDVFVLSPTLLIFTAQAHRAAATTVYSSLDLAVIIIAAYCWVGSHNNLG